MENITTATTTILQPLYRAIMMIGTTEQPCALYAVSEDNNNDRYGVS